MDKIALNVLLQEAAGHEAKGNTAAALETLRRAVADYPGAPTARIRYGIAAERAGEHAVAEAAFTAAISLTDDPPPWWHARLATIHLVQGKREEAAAAYRTALQRAPDHSAWRAALNELDQYSRGEGASVQYYDEIYSASDTSYTAGVESSPYIPMWERIAELLTQRGAQRVLDVGCGPGQFATFLLDRCDVEYTGFDFSPVAIERAGEWNLPGTFVCADLFTTDLFDQPWDAIVCTEVLEHIDDDLGAFSRFPIGAYALCSVPNFPAFGHLRTFASESQVRSRYGGRLRRPKIESFSIGGILYLLHGVVRRERLSFGTSSRVPSRKRRSAAVDG